MERFKLTGCHVRLGKLHLHLPSSKVREKNVGGNVNDIDSKTLVLIVDAVIPETLLSSLIIILSITSLITIFRLEANSPMLRAIMCQFSKGMLKQRGK